MSQKRHIMHGRDHLPGGADPVGRGANIDLGRYVIAGTPVYRNLWVGGHEPTDCGPDAKTTIACPLITTSGAAPVDQKFYDHSVSIEFTGYFGGTYGADLGIEFETFVTELRVTGVQFWRSAIEGTGTANVYLWDYAGTELLASGAGPSATGWNEIYFDTAEILATTGNYVVSWGPVGGRPSGPGGGDTPKSAPGLASTNSSFPWVYSFPAVPGERPGFGGDVDYGVGPIIDYTPTAGDPRIVATASHGTDDGVWIHRTEKGDNLIDIFWSASDSIVAANVFVMGIDPGGTQPCDSEHYKLLGNCVIEGLMIPPGLKAWRRRKLSQKYPNGKVTAHFRHQEFWCRDGTPIPSSDVNLRALERHCQTLLEPLRAKFGACHVMSGYRHRSYNASIGGASESFHIWDDEKRRPYPATDLIFATGSPSKWGAEARRLMLNANSGNGGVGIYTRQGFVHVDLRPYVSNWRGT